jgi:hypothetical protein
MRRHDLQLVPGVEGEPTSVDLAEILLARPAAAAVLRVVPPSDEDPTPDDAA